MLICPIPKGLRNCKTFTKTPFLNFRDRPKNGEGNKQRRR